jgi:hypothetical protein
MIRRIYSTVLTLFLASSLAIAAPLSDNTVLKVKSGIATSSLITDDGTNVGIGIRSPQGVMNVSGAIYASTIKLFDMGPSTFSGGYVVFGSNTTTMNPIRVNDVGDVYIKHNLEVDGSLYVDGWIYSRGVVIY